MSELIAGTHYTWDTKLNAEKKHVYWCLECDEKVTHSNAMTAYYLIESHWVTHHSEYLK